MCENGDIAGTKLSANAAISEKRGTTLSANAAVQEAGTVPVAHYPEMPPCVKNGDSTGSTLSANAAMRKQLY